jgi:AraC family transcriptional regulator
LTAAFFAIILLHIENKLESDLSQAELAEAVGLTTRQFVRAFKAATGVSPRRFVMLRRLARARWLIRTTGLPLPEVATLCGFSSHTHLIRVPRRKAGHSFWGKRLVDIDRAR